MLLLTIVFYCAKAQSEFKTIPGKPNVIIILSDDQGYGDFSIHGNPILKTPALDKMYTSGVRFSNFHVAPLCTPTRGQLLTGLDAMKNKASTVLTGRGLMRRNVVTMPELFLENGYRTGIFGKWHLGDTYPDRPMDRGFEKNVWTKGWGLLSESEFDNDYYKTRFLDGFDTVYSNQYCTDLWFDQAMKWIDRLNKAQPFFAYIALNAPHGPFHAPAADAKRYRSLVGDDPTASFLGMISSIDRNMERLDQWLNETGLKENTIVIFMNDNGGTGGVKVYNAGMRGEKTSLYDGGHRAACFMNGPQALIGTPRTIGHASTIQDLFPTLIDLCGLKSKNKHSFDGNSLKPLLQDTEHNFRDRMFVVQYTGNDKPEKYYSCVVWDSWRLVGENELYDISKDSGQVNNVSSNYPEVFQKMKNFYEKWWQELEPSVFEIVPVVVGNKKEDPVILTSNSWVGAGGINTQWAVANATGNPRGGVWHIEFEKKGRYSVELSRWPFHLQRTLSSAGPATAIGGTKLREGKALPIEYGCISINKEQPLIVKADKNASSINANMKLKKGTNVLQAWFRDGNDKDLCGSYYLRIKKL